MTAKNHTTRWLLFAAAALTVAVIVVVVGGRIATRVYFDDAAARGQTTLRLAVSALDGHMRRFEALPALIADHAGVKALITDPQNTFLRSETNRYLKETNALLRSSDIYIMVPGGDTIAASNHDGPLSFVGENFSYRPYFQEAMAGRPGRFFALGTTSLKRGYYFSSPVFIGREVRGVVVFKVDLDAIEASWRGGEHEIIVTDPEGIVFMSGRPDWLYAGLLPLTPERLARTEESRRYANASLRELPLSYGELDEHRLMTLSDDGSDREYLVLPAAMADAGWTVSVLTDTASAHRQAYASVAAALLVLGLAALLAAIVAQRRARLAERMELQRSAQAELERRVAERTADLALVNSRLETEVAERRTAEQQLRQSGTDDTR